MAYLQFRVAARRTQSPIKSITRGSLAVDSDVTNPATATIAAVDFPNSYVRWNQCNSGANANTPNSWARVELTSSTVISAYSRAGGDAVTTTIYYEVVECWPGTLRRVQRGTVAAFTTATISAVTLKRTELYHAGTRCTTGASGFQKDIMQAIDLTSETVITSHGAGTNASETGYNVVERLT